MRNKGDFEIEIFAVHNHGSFHNRHGCEQPAKALVLLYLALHKCFLDGLQRRKRQLCAGAAVCV